MEDVHLDEEDRGKQKLQEAEDQEDDFQEVQVEQQEDNTTREAKRRVLIVTNGTRGDVQPFVALGLTSLFMNKFIYYIVHSTFGCVNMFKI